MPTAHSIGVSRPATFMLLFMISCFFVPVVALCECGYRSDVDALGTHFIYTDLIESDFLHIRDITLDTDWQRQNFIKTPEAGRGPYGMNFTITNIASNPIPDHHNWTGPGRYGGDPGVQLVVKGGIPLDGYVDIAQMDSIRTDLLWGSYRASLKLPSAVGTCAAFFWYFNDSQEIDMEFLSGQYDYEKMLFPVNLVLQTPKSASQGFSEKGSNNFVLANLTFDPTAGFHEYRMDFVPGNVVFFADGEVLAIMETSFTPTESGHMILTHWSNGNELWSQGPPTQDSIMTVAYVKAYFNSTRSDRQKAYGSRCLDAGIPDALCVIPHQQRASDSGMSVKNLSSAEMYFFIDQADMAEGQIYYEKSGVTALRIALFDSLAFMLLLSTAVAIFL